MNPETYRVPPDQLRTAVSLVGIKFETTADIPSLDATVGQDRAVQALTFGLRIGQDGYNIYAAGVPGTGKSTMVRRLVTKFAEDQPVPDDWCYVYNFQKPENPRAIRLNAGEGQAFQEGMSQFIQYIKAKIPDVFQSKDYIEERDEIIERGNKAKEALFQEIVERGRDHGFEIKSTRTGFKFSPIRKGKTLRKEDFDLLDHEEQKEIEEKQKIISDYLRDLLVKFQRLDKETESRLEKFQKDAANFVIEGRFRELEGKYKDHQGIAAYLKEVYEDVLTNFKDFIPSSQPALNLFGEVGNHADHMHIRYRVNLLVDNGETRGAPVVEETNPIHVNLVGRIEKRTKFGTLQTDFTLIRAGSILKANGGYLIIHILDLLTHPFAWEALKKALENKELQVEDMGELYGLISTIGMKPEPIPVDLKVVVIGNSYIYSLLQYYDEDFLKLFKVKADFNTRTRRTEGEVVKYVQFAAKICRDEQLNHFDRDAIRELIILISRMVEHKDRLSLRFNEVANLIREAAFCSREEGAAVVTAKHVEQAWQAKIYRSNLVEEQIQEEIDEQVLMVDVEKEKVGQVNGLVVYALGDYAFGKPTRITSRTFLGRKGVVNVERESELSGKTHSKGVMILGNYLGGRYAQEHSLSLSASLAFEQSYGEVDGDSASAAELVALVSSLTGIPVRQDLAITGSINQHGEIQPIGGVNEKIEGFFQTCRNRGLTGSQGVIIPHQNVRHLCLARDVVEAVEEGRFHLYQVSQVDEALALMTGMEAGVEDEQGQFPPNTLNGKVQTALRSMHDKLEENHDEDEEESDDDGDGG
ncbi:MAG: ATP-binding protein [bacterium]|nr:ATP-binding protein [bacterium]